LEINILFDKIAKGFKTIIKQTINLPKSIRTHIKIASIPIEKTPKNILVIANDPMIIIINGLLMKTN